jgi:hypothetical protein
MNRAAPLMLMSPLSLSLLLGACASTPPLPEPQLRTIYVETPLMVACIPDTLEAAPDYPDTDERLRAAPDAAVRYQLLFAGRQLRVARLNEVEPVIETCRQAGEE